MKTLVCGGMIYSRGRALAGDVLIEDGTIVAIGDCRGLAGGAEVVRAEGQHVLPGLMDLHVHLDDKIGRFHLADTWATGSLAAASAGITTLGGFITQRRDEALEEAVSRAVSLAQGRSFCDCLWHLTPTRFDQEDLTEVDRLLDSGWLTFKFYTTYRESGLFISYDRLARLAERLSPAGARLLVHCEDEDVLARARVLNAGSGTAADHGRQRPPEAERQAVERVIEAAATTGAWFHVVHVSTPEAAKAIALARASTRLTCESAPHYLFLDDSWLQRADGHLWLCTPPLRDKGRMNRLREMALEGAFDLFASDHCAFRFEDKETGRTDVSAAPMGLAGLGALPRLVFSLNRDRPERAFAEMSLRLAEGPARLAGLEGRKGALEPGLDGDVAVFELEDCEEELVTASAGRHETYPGFSSPLRLRHLFLRGIRIVADGEWLGAAPPPGKCLWTR